MRRALLGGLAESLLDDALGVGSRLAITVHGTMTCCEVVPGPFDIGDGDPAVGAVGDRLEDPVVGQRRRIAMALDLQFVRRHGQRNVDGQHQFDVDRLGGDGSAPASSKRQRGTAPQRQLSPQEAEQT